MDQSIGPLLPTQTPKVSFKLSKLSLLSISIVTIVVVSALLFSLFIKGTKLRIMI